jgi:DNA-binding MurR/RpiR family transcriptional regulator
MNAHDNPPVADARRANNQRVGMTALESRFEEAKPNLNSSRSRLIRDILENAEDTYFLSARALAKRYDIDKATVVRSVQILGI